MANDTLKKLDKVAGRTVQVIGQLRWRIAIWVIVAFFLGIGLIVAAIILYANGASDFTWGLVQDIGTAVLTGAVIAAVFSVIEYYMRIYDEVMRQGAEIIVLIRNELQQLGEGGQAS